MNRKFVYLLTLAFVGLFTTTALGQEATFYEVTPVYVVDGDTWDVTVTFDAMGMVMYARMRPLELDCAEPRGDTKELGLEQKAILQELLESATRHRIEVYGRDSFGRWLVYAWADSIEVSTYMREQGCDTWP